jgi:hypothetical protein
MAVYDMKSLAAHAHHSIECVTYGKNSIVSSSLECMTCGEVLVSYDADGETEYCVHCDTAIVPRGPPICEGCFNRGHEGISADCQSCLDNQHQEHERLLNELSNGLMAKYFRSGSDRQAYACVGYTDLLCIYEQLLAVEEGYA